MPPAEQQEFPEKGRRMSAAFAGRRTPSVSFADSSPGGGAKVGILPSGKGGTIPAGGGGGPCKGDRERCLNLERCSMNENKKKDKTKNAYGLPLGMCMGIAVGTAIGAATDNIGLWMSIGLSAGLCLGLTLGHSGEEDNGEHTDDKQ